MSKNKNTNINAGNNVNLEVQWYKEDILGFSCYRHRRDLLQVLLEDMVLYSKKDVNEIMKKFEEEVI